MKKIINKCERIGRKCQLYCVKAGNIGAKLVCPMSTRSGYSSVATEPEDQQVDSAAAVDSMQLNNSSVSPVQAAAAATGRMTTRKWRQFPGRNQFYCNGRLMLGRGLGLFYLTCVLIVVTTLLFLAFECVLLFTAQFLGNHSLRLCNYPDFLHYWTPNSVRGVGKYTPKGATLFTEQGSYEYDQIRISFRLLCLVV